MVRHQQSHTLIVVVKAATSNRLPAASRARLKVATDQMQLATKDSAVVALWKIQIFLTRSVRHSVKLLTVDDKLHGTNFGLLVAVPSRFFGIPGHAMMPNDPSSATAGLSGWTTQRVSMN
jgi:hypothetical protein